MIDFQTYDTANPHVYAAFKAKAIEAMQKGFKTYGAKALFEVIRWQSKTHGNDEFKINNIYVADYARKLMQERAEFKDFFHCRTLRAYRGKAMTKEEMATEFDNLWNAIKNEPRCTCERPRRVIDENCIPYCGICDMNL